jgi:hypothetical protein
LGLCRKVGSLVLLYISSSYIYFVLLRDTTGTWHTH